MGESPHSILEFLVPLPVLFNMLVYEHALLLKFIGLVHVGVEFSSDQQLFHDHLVPGEGACLVRKHILDHPQLFVQGAPEGLGVDGLL